MYTLRAITKEGVEENTLLGNSYSVIRQPYAKSKYEKLLSAYVGVKEYDRIFGFIVDVHERTHLGLSDRDWETIA